MWVCSFEFAKAMLSFVHVIHMRSVLLGSRHFSLVLFGFIGVWNVKFLSFVYFCQVTCILCFHWLGFLVLLFCVARVVFLSSAACFRVVMFCEDAQSRRALIGSMFVSCFVCAMSFSISCLNPAHYLTWFICPACSYSLPPILLLFILPVFSVLCQIVG